MIKTNRFPELVDALMDLHNGGRGRVRSSEMSESALRGIDSFVYPEIKAFQPTPQPARRYGHFDKHTRISEGWKPSLFIRHQGSSGASLWIDNTSEHINAQRTGVQTTGKRYGARGGQNLIIWMEPGNIYTPEIREEVEARVAAGGDPIFFRKRVKQHGFPAWGGSDFVERAARSVRSEMRGFFYRRADKIAYDPLRQFFRS